MPLGWTSIALSWPHGTEFVDSFLKLDTFTVLSFRLSFDDPDFCRFLEHVSFTILQRLADINHRKSLMADWTRSGFGSATIFIFGILATAQASSHTKFECIRIGNFDRLVPTAFLLVCFRYDYPQ